MQILFIEDDTMLSEGLIKALRRHGFTAETVDTAQQGLLYLKTENPDILILDLGLPDMDGLDFLKQIRQQGFDLPVLILTARDGLPNKVTGLDAGADDYLVKPFEIDELLARLRVLERRLGNASSSELSIGPVLLDIAAGTLTVEGELQTLPRREFMLLKSLMENAGSIQTKEVLESRLYNLGEEVGSNTVEVHIHHLRKKLPDDFIKTVRGVGYVVKKQ